MPELSRRNLLRGGAGLTGALALSGLAACSRTGSDAVAPTSDAVTSAEAARKVSGGRVVTAQLTPRPATIDLGGRTVETWTYGETLPGPLLRATAGDILRIQVDNSLPTDTSVHWHGIALRNDMDGVPGITQDPIRSASSFTYEFTVPDPGTYFYHPHSGVQLDRGLYGALIVDDPAEVGNYDEEWVVILDDWLDGTGRTPDQVLARLMKTKGSDDSGMSGMSGMDHGSTGGMGMMEGAQSPLLGGAGDISYPYFLINGRTPDAPVTLSSKPGRRARIRVINAGSDTAFRVALGGHRMTVTHSDGYPVVPAATDALLIGMGERYDVTVTLGDGVFPLVARAEGKGGQGLAMIRTGGGRAPTAAVRTPELGRRVLTGTDLAPAPSGRLKSRQVDRSHTLHLSGSMAPYRWTIGGQTYPDAEPLPVAAGERVQLKFMNMSMMFHPMHVHGHTFAVVGSGVRKDTVIVRPMETVAVDLDADNPGQWATHCHNLYHAEAGMMTSLSYRT